MVKKSYFFLPHHMCIWRLPLG